MLMSSFCGDVLQSKLLIRGDAAPCCILASKSKPLTHNLPPGSQNLPFSTSSFNLSYSSFQMAWGWQFHFAATSTMSSKAKWKQIPSFIYLFAKPELYQNILSHINTSCGARKRQPTEIQVPTLSKMEQFFWVPQICLNRYFAAPPEGTLTMICAKLAVDQKHRYK